MKLALFALALAPLPLLIGATPEKSAFAPLDYFAANCARCHGPYGEFYGAGFAQNKTDDQLRQIVQEMAEGPGNAPLENAELDILTAYHLSLRDQKPFLVVVKRETDGDFVNWSGEATPDSKLTYGQTKVPLDGHQWKLRLPAQTEEKTCLEAEKDGKKTVLALVKKS